MESMKIAAIKYVAGKSLEAEETLAGEEALQIKINGTPYTITMRTPGQDAMLVAGLLFTERLINRAEDILNISEIPAEHGGHTVIAEVQVREETLAGKNLVNRSIASNASCGVCGKIELCDLLTPEKALLTAETLDIEHIPHLLSQMQAAQLTFDKTGGSHAAAIFRIDGKLLSVKEDIGRHNAVDKVIGDLLLRDQLHEAAILFVSGRTSYEIASKCGEASIPFLLGVSAPSSLAAEYCRRKGITLIGFCRENRATVYVNEKRIKVRNNRINSAHYHEAE